MADTILLKGGKKANMPTLSAREIACATDEKALYIGINGTNVRLCGADDQADTLPELAPESDLATVISAYNSLLAALKAGKLMK